MTTARLGLVQVHITEPVVPVHDLLGGAPIAVPVRPLSLPERQAALLARETSVTARERLVAQTAAALGVAGEWGPELLGEARARAIGRLSEGMTAEAVVAEIAASVALEELLEAVLAHPDAREIPEARVVACFRRWRASRASEETAEAAK